MNVPADSAAQNEAYVRSLIHQSLHYIINEMQSPEIRARVNKELLDPVITYIGKRLYPYVLVASLCFVFLLVAVACLLYARRAAPVPAAPVPAASLTAAVSPT